MTLRTLALAGAAAVALVGVSPVNAAPQAQDTRHLEQIGPDGMPATWEDQQRRERTPRDMAPNTGYRTAQAEKPGDQHMTTPLPPTTGTEAKAVSLSQVDTPDRTLINAPVESKDGHKIGEVAQVSLDANGKAREVVLKGPAGTRIAAGELVYVPDRGVLVTQLTPSDLAPAKAPPDSTVPPHSLPPTPGTPPEAPLPNTPNKPGSDGT